VRDPEAAILSIAERYGDPFTVPTFGGPIVVTSSPEGVKEIFGADPETFAPFNVEGFLPILGAGSV
jgi:cytochrome P450 family 110